MTSQQVQPRNVRALHGVVYIAIIAGSLLVPVRWSWPWWWVVSLGTYFAIVGAVPVLRRSLKWACVGRLNRATVAVTVAIMLVTTGVLVLFEVLVRPELSGFRGAMPAWMPNLILAGALFSAINATLEELVFRGILFDAIRSQWSAGVTVLATGLVFGLGHLHGYPPGAVGVVLACIYGLVLGWLREWSGGLAMPIVAHMGADATIFWILARGGVLGAI